MYSFGRNIEPGQQDYGETLTVVVGKHDVPVAVEKALVVSSTLFDILYFSSHGF